MCWGICLTKGIGCLYNKYLSLIDILLILGIGLRMRNESLLFEVITDRFGESRLVWIGIFESDCGESNCLVK